MRASPWYTPAPRAETSGPKAFRTEELGVVEIDSDNQMVAYVAFDIDDIDAAVAELDARYLAGEAAVHAHTWSIIMRAFSAANRNELPATTPDWVSVDHRRGRSFAPGELEAYMRATWDAIPDTKIFVDSVHRLSDLGAVVTHAVRGTSRDGFDAEWREVSLTIVDGELFKRTELFDETDLDVALARFEGLHRSTTRLGNAASRAVEQFLAHFAVSDWDAMAGLFAEDISSDDRRGVVNAGIRHGRNAEMANWRATAEIWMPNVGSIVLATRGERLTLMRFTFISKEQSREAFSAAALAVVEIDDDGRNEAIIVFDVDDIDAAFEELDARYLAGEAAPRARTWSLTSQAYTQHSTGARYPR